jgi:hypothetical protein
VRAFKRLTTPVFGQLTLVLGSVSRLDDEGAVDETGMPVCGLLWSVSSCDA